MASSSTAPKNDTAWHQLFADHDILPHLRTDGAFRIASAAINRRRESRLMTKFDHSVNRPAIFKEHELSILPLSRSEYLIGYLDTHAPVTYPTDPHVHPVHLRTDLQTIDYADLYSEAIALNCAHAAGLIDDLAGEPTRHTVSGRMSSGQFQFTIASTSRTHGPYILDIANAQCEIDGGYEGPTKFLLIEAKNYRVDDFLVRQLYYPYRRWTARIDKPVVPILMTFAQDHFDFFIYDFADPQHYNSLTLHHHRRYAIEPATIHPADVIALYQRTQPILPPVGVPLPQADNFPRLLDLLGLLSQADLTAETITLRYQFDARQTSYYTDAGRYLRLIQRSHHPLTREPVYALTVEARRLLQQRPQQKILQTIRTLLLSPVLHEAFAYSPSPGSLPTTEQLVPIVQRHHALNTTTAQRRARTIRSWLDWIWLQTTP